VTRLGRLLVAAALVGACSTSHSATPPSVVALAPAPPGWTMFRGDLARDGHPPGATLAAAAASRLTLAWQTDLRSPVVAGPVLAGSTLVVGTLGGTLEALSAETGEKLWSVTGLGPLSGQPLIFEDKVFVGSSEGRLYAVELVTGTRIWDWRAPGVKPAIWDGPAVYRGLLLLGVGSQAGATAAEPGRLVALDPASGDRLWASCLSPDCTPGGAIASSIAVDSTGHGYVGVGSPNDALAAFDAGIGRVGWQRSLYPDRGRGLGVVATPLLLRSHGRVRVAVGGLAGTFAVFDAATGSVVWSRDLASASPGLQLTGSPGFDGRNLYVPLAGSSGGMLALAPDTGLPVWSHPSARPVLTSPAIGKDVVVYGEGAATSAGAGGAVVALSARDGHELWRQETVAPVVASLVLAGNAVYAAGGQGQVLAFRPAG
jgi:outer membrane protein assembly factor BamB